MTAGRCRSPHASTPWSTCSASWTRCVERLQGHAPSAQETYLYLLAVLHEDMHGEALTYMRQTLSYPAPHWALAVCRAP